MQLYGADKYRGKVQDFSGARHLVRQAANKGRLTGDLQAVSSGVSNKEARYFRRKQPQVLEKQRDNFIRKVVYTEKTLIFWAEFGPEISVLEVEMVRGSWTCLGGTDNTRDSCVGMGLRLKPSHQLCPREAVSREGGWEGRISRIRRQNGCWELQNHRLQLWNAS